MTTTETTYSVLNNLLETCRDGQNGFDTAAKAVEDPSMKAELMQYSMQRQDFAAELRTLIAGQGEKPDDGGSLAAAVHRGWINVKSLVTGSSVHSVLSECERGEDSAVQAYRDAINADLPPAVEPIIRTQFEQVQRVHDRVRALRDASKASS